ncbi:MAG TPA: 50S ribosomal protein L23 [Candidatus Paceibacterota bacterium]
MPTDTKQKQLGNNRAVVLRRPLVTEKSTDGISAARGATPAGGQGRPCYTFVVGPTANKFMVRQAIIERYKVTPVRINMSIAKKKRITTRGRVGARGGFKKAMVYLKSGDKIEL